MRAIHGRVFYDNVRLGNAATDQRVFAHDDLLDGLLVFENDYFDYHVRPQVIQTNLQFGR